MSSGGDSDKHREHPGDHRQYYPNYCRPISASSSSQALPSRCYEDLSLQAIR
ncbi:hypothetical protein RDI58_029195 [Solanum bulbocastanum]|uniref:Uncharacterized protein n=1 Tax=Solanum bulbocastanum TaxID=147425 RepID=A0AAN8SVY8_SOLBU